MPRDTKAQNHPFQNWREDQLNAIDACIEAKNRKYKYIIIEGPCGSGKSSVAVEILRRFGRGRLLTSQVLLQRQYKTDYNEFEVLEGAGRYTCHMQGPPKILAGRRVSPSSFDQVNFGKVSPNCGSTKWFHRSTATFSRCEECCYLVALNKAVQAPYSILNYHSYYYQNRVRDNLLKGTNLVLDEAHNLNSITTDLYTREFTEFAGFSFPRLSSSDCYRPPYKGVADITNKDYVEQVFSDYEKHLKKRIKVCDNRKSQESYKELDWAKEKLAQVQYHAKYVQKTAFTYTLLEDAWASRLKVKPIDARGLIKNCFYGGNDCIIFMSATIIDKEVFCREVGLDSSKTFHYQMEDVFKSQNHTIRFVPKPQNMQLKSRKVSLEKSVQTIKDILAKHKDEKGIIHAQTHAVCKKLTEAIPDARLTYYKDRDYCLKEHARKSRSVIVSPSMKEGLDLKGTESTFQILVVVPYPMFDLHTINKMKVNGKYYQWATTVAFVQSLGRSVRSESDICTTYLVDSRFFTLINSMENKFSQYLLESLPFDMEKITLGTNQSSSLSCL